ncbi:polysaccharide biosynthesis/export family protein [Thioclava sp. JE_KL1]|uniref:polysaccharide biosynthesis/export family protein n=1 Tax=Thioclava sp. JE_KL1 TaxID=2651187 RepID=UPI00128CFC2C|nr:hypothetical protein [Thioclava sp. JE_KL1]
MERAAGYQGSGSHDPGSSVCERGEVAVPMSRVPLRRFLFPLAVTALTAFPAYAEKLEAGDVVSLNIVEWRSVAGEMAQWAALKGPYEISSDGALDIGFIGKVETKGREAEAVAEEISARLKDTLALTEQLDVQLSITQRAPVIVGGLARKPGPVDFTSGMTVRHALALAGGLTGVSGDGTMSQYLSIAAQEAQLARQEGDLRLRIARLDAEQAGTTDANFPTAASLGQDGELRVAQEQSLLKLRLDSAKRKSELVDGQVTLLTQEIDKLQQKSKGLDHQRELIAEQRDKVAQLVDRGLSPSNRAIEAEQKLAAIQSQILDVDTAILRSRQALARAENDRLDLGAGRITQLLNDKQKAESELSDVRERLDLQRGLMRLAVPSAIGAGLAGEEGGPQLQVVVTPAGGGTAKTVADFDTRLSPGDLVEVTLSRDPNETAATTEAPQKQAAGSNG